MENTSNVDIGQIRGFEDSITNKILYSLHANNKTERILTYP